MLLYLTITKITFYTQGSSVLLHTFTTFRGHYQKMVLIRMFLDPAWQQSLLWWSRSQCSVVTWNLEPFATGLSAVSSQATCHINVGYTDLGLLYGKPLGKRWVKLWNLCLLHRNKRTRRRCYLLRTCWSAIPGCQRWHCPVVINLFLGQPLAGFSLPP